ncbi:MAG: helix-turn-helix transcriptional regulator [Gammaproteobacteria bacterium]|nr:helix-turn-helix transcriptional regulator [Gammaproteobacteria bacterium]
MVQSTRIVQALKQALRHRGVSYKQVADHLGLSLSSVKRLFSTGGFTLQRLEAVCDMADIDLLELTRRAEAQRLRVTSLNRDLERELVANPVLLLVATCALNRWPFERIVERYRISELQLIQYLARLDRMGLIELLPGNRIRPRVARRFAWLPNGPIHRYFVEHVQNSFLSGAFEPKRDLHRFAWGMLSEESAAALRAKLVDLMESFDALTRGDEIRPAEEDRTKGSCLLVALREWEPAEFEGLRRPLPDRDAA